MTMAFELHGLTKRFGGTTALDGVTLEIPAGAVVGLVGRNGSGKTTLLRHVVGLYVPTEGRCATLGTPADRLGADEFRRIGVVHQRGGCLYWMTVEQHLRYVASFYPSWDRDLENRLVDELEVDRTAKTGALSPGNLQKVALLTAVCHHPELLVLDEPVSAMDPIVRERTLAFLLERLQHDRNTIIVSSHVLRDIEQIVSHVVCLERGRVIVDAPLDQLQEQYAEWTVTSRSAALPAAFPEPFVLTSRGEGRRAHLIVRDDAETLAAFRTRYEADVETRPLNLERMFPFLLREP